MGTAPRLYIIPHLSGLSGKTREVVSTRNTFSNSQKYLNIYHRTYLCIYYVYCMKYFEISLMGKLRIFLQIHIFLCIQLQTYLEKQLFYLLRLQRLLYFGYFIYLNIFYAFCILLYFEINA